MSLPPRSEALDAAYDAEAVYERATKDLRATAADPGDAAAVEAYVGAPTEAAERLAFFGMVRRCERNLPLKEAFFAFRSAAFGRRYWLEIVQAHEAADRTAVAS